MSKPKSAVAKVHHSTQHFKAVPKKIDCWLSPTTQETRKRLKTVKMPPMKGQTMHNSYRAERKHSGSFQQEEKKSALS